MTKCVFINEIGAEFYICLTILPRIGEKVIFNYRMMIVADIIYDLDHSDDGVQIYFKFV